MIDPRSALYDLIDYMKLGALVATDFVAGMLVTVAAIVLWLYW